jgi:hypothetical protein
MRSLPVSDVPQVNGDCLQALIGDVREPGHGPP